MELKGKKCLVGVGGGIAAYKACELVRRLSDLGAEVRVILTEAAQKFVTALTFQSLTRHSVHTDLFSLTEESEMSHIKLADEADLFIIAPATADLLAKLAHGFAGDLLTTAVLVTQAPVFLAPSMNVNMWEKDVVQDNIRLLKERGYRIVEPEVGTLACGWEGKGRLAETDAILQALSSGSSRQVSPKKKSLTGRKILINAGPTREYLDPVRFLSNPSSGKMGFALAEAAQRRGAQVTLVAGPVQLSTPDSVQRVDVTSGEEMLQACRKFFSKADIFIATAAVGDYAPAKREARKIKKNGKALKLALQPSADILQTLAKEKKKGQIVVGFAAETDNLVRHAQGKLKKKNLDLVVANDVSLSDRGFSSDQNEVVLVGPQNKIKTLELGSKRQIAEGILDAIEGLISRRT